MPDPQNHSNAQELPQKLSQLKPDEIAGLRKLGDGTVSVVTVQGQKITVADDGKK